MNCSYCTQPTTDNYCSHCGQRVITRFTWKMAMSWVQDELFVLDRGFFYTIKELVLHPTRLIHDYLAGSTKKYFNPFKLLVILSTAPVAIILLFSDDHVDLGTIMRGGPPAFTSTSFSYLLEQWPLFMVPNLIYHVTITMVLLAGLCKLLFKQRGFNYLEHLIVLCFMAGFMLLLNYGTAPIWAFALHYTPDVQLFLLTPAWIMITVYLVLVFKKIYQYSFGATLVRGFACVYGALIPSLLLQLLVLSVIQMLWQA